MILLPWLHTVSPINIDLSTLHCDKPDLLALSLKVHSGLSAFKSSLKSHNYETSLKPVKLGKLTCTSLLTPT